MDKFKVALIQMVSKVKLNDNLIKAEELISAAACNGAQMVILPEFFIQITSSMDPNRYLCAEELGKGKIQDYLSQLAQKYQVFLVAGTILIKPAFKADKFYNTSLIYDPAGKLLAYYHKMHLFKYDDGVNSFDEGASFFAGDKLCVFEVNGFKLGLGVCYDLRFPEFFRALGLVDGIILPAAFTYVTGKAHWEILIRARAIENQCYFFAVNQGGIHESGRHSYGHSQVVNPWGEIINQIPEGEGIIYAELSHSHIVKYRKLIPALEHKLSWNL